MKVFVVGGSIGYANWIDDCKIVDTIEEADLVFFTGGEDVYPPLYGEEGKFSYHGPVKEKLGMPRRDHEEVTAYKYAVENNKPMFGTCRGLQMLTVLNGGKLIQDMDHPWGHGLEWHDGTVSNTNSLHHQMCWPFNLPKEDYRVLAWATTSKYDTTTDKLLSQYFRSETINEKPPVEPEVIHFPKTRSLGIQGHPEMMRDNEELIDKLNTLLKTL